MSARVRQWMLCSLVIATCGWIAAQRPIPQNLRYHAFADQRTALGVPYFWDVVSNLPFLAVGIIGLYTLRRGGRHPVSLAWSILFISIILVAFGSGYYHLAPDNRRLTWDRLPMTVAFMSLLSIVVGEWIDARLGRRCLPILLLLGALSVVYWHVTESQGRGDLRPYIAVQFVPLAIIPLITLMFRSKGMKAGYIMGALAAYIAAKVFEILDEPVFRATGLLSGHTLKHLAGAVGAWLLVVASSSRFRSCQ